jgi:cell division transport system ATP-binding protein
MIELSHVYKTYPGPVHAISNLELRIDKGEFVFLTGPSGAGKSTLFRMISAYDKPTSGHVTVAGYDLTQVTAAKVPYFRRQIGVVFQDFKLLKNRTILENIALPLEIRGERKSAIRERVHRVLDQVGLTFKEDSLPEQLSGGEQQRVAIARALVHQPEVLIADEPTGNLDRTLSLEIMDLLERVNSQGTTVFVATHDLELVKRKPRRHVQLKSGTLIGDIK